MKIKTVSYSKDEEIRKFIPMKYGAQRHRIEATAEVSRGETPEQCLEALKEWVNGQLYDTITTIVVTEEVKVRQ